MKFLFKCLEVGEPKPNKNGDLRTYMTGRVEATGEFAFEAVVSVCVETGGIYWPEAQGKSFSPGRAIIARTREAISKAPSVADWLGRPLEL